MTSSRSPDAPSGSAKVGSTHGWGDHVNRAEQGDLVAYQSTWRGTHLGLFRDIPPTGKRLEWQATCFRRVRDGRVVEGWGTYDWLGVLEQLGATVTPSAGERP